jgi:hypothetical protein
MRQWFRASEMTYAYLPRLVLALALLAPATAGFAANVTITGDKPRQSITVTAEDANIAAVLEALSSKYGLEVEGLQLIDPAETQTITLTGDLYKVLGRLLRNRNHVIVRSAEAPSGVAKVMILNAAVGAKSLPAGPALGQPGADKQGTPGEGE